VIWNVESQVAMNMSKTSSKTTVEWNQVNWRKLERQLFKLQTRIYKASQRGDVKAVRRLQKTLMRSWSAKCLSVRRVTQDNNGKKTAGVDGVKSLSPKARLTLVANLKLNSRVKPTRRVWIPKPGCEEKRPLGIPTMYDRALQALVKLAIEPEWEARFEPNSYGFRPGRSCHDAIGAIYNAIRLEDKYVLDADIAKCFDKINQEALVRKLNTFPTINRQIRAWLKAGVIDNNTFLETSEGTPQGGVISPLLANIALHGLETVIRQAFPNSITKDGKQYQKWKPTVIRYADDFVIVHKDLAVVQRCQQLAAEWLAGMGLELKPSKTRITHTFHKHEGNAGFDFLGYNVRQYPVGKSQSAKKPNGVILGFKTIIKPSKTKIKEHVEKIGHIIKTHKSATQANLIRRLNPVIKEWSNYYSTVVSKETYSESDRVVYQQLRAWANYRHPKKGRKWTANKYWQTIGKNNWVFATQDGEAWLFRHSETPIKRHVKVLDTRSPYDGDWVYWSTRMGKHPEAPKRVTTLLKRQKGRCTHCGLYFKDGDKLETDHKIPKSKDGRNSYDNLQLLHRHCHDNKTALDVVGTKELDEHWLDSSPF
jgi:RNA-directed DNA polymerase